MDAYWDKRSQQLNAQLEKDEKTLFASMDKMYAKEAAALEKDIGAYYAQYGENDVIAYRKLMERLDDADRDLLLRRAETFATKNPQYAHLLPVRESIYKLDRMEGLQQSIYMQQLELAASDTDALTRHLAKNALRGAEGAAKFMGGGSFAVREDVVKNVVGAAWADGKNFSQRIWENRTGLANHLNHEFSAAIARGDNFKRCAKRIQEKFSVGAAAAKRIAYTEGTYVMSESSIQAFEPYYERYALSSVGDGRVCDTCAAMHKKEFFMSQRKAGVNFPPLHPRCRCGYTVVLESEKDISGKVADIADTENVLYEVTDAAIGRVPKPFFQGLTNKANTQAQEYAKEVLRRVKGLPLGTEATVSFAVTGQAKSIWAVGNAAQGRVRVQSMDMPYYSLHNHASNGILSPEDIAALIRHDNMQGVGAVGNNGALFTCEKGYGFDKGKASELYRSVKEKYPMHLEDASQARALMKEFMKGATAYGMHFI